MPQKGQITSNKQWAFWCYSYEEWGICEYKEASDSRNQDEGPFNTFSEAKKALVKVLSDRAFDYKINAQKARKIKKSDI